MFDQHSELHRSIALYGLAMKFSSKGRKIAGKDDGNQGSIFLPEELVNEILLRLHIRPLFRFKLVSKRWNSIISHPKFGYCYMQRASSSSKSSSQWHLWGIPLDLSANAPPFIGHKSYWPCEDPILASSGGLILSISRNGYYSSQGLNGVLRVFNPLTKKSAKLPLLSCLSCFPLTFGLATRRHVEPAGGDHPADITYKVVVIQNSIPHHPGDDAYEFEIYTFSSDIGRWTQKNMTTTCVEFDALLCNAMESFTCRGILHWFDWYKRRLITYDPYNSPDRFGRIQLPTGSGETLENSGMNLIHFGHEDAIKFGDIECCNDHVRRLRVWQLLDHAKGEWRLEQTCPISPLLVDKRLRWLRILVPQDPCNDELFCLIVEDMCRKMTAIDLGSAKVVFVDPSKLRTSIETYSSAVGYKFCLPITLCPWSSPFYGSRS